MATAASTGKVDPKLTQRLEELGTVYTAPIGSKVTDASAAAIAEQSRIESPRSGNRASSPLGERKAEVKRPSDEPDAASTETDRLVTDPSHEEDEAPQPKTCWERAADYCCCCFGTKQKDQ